MAAETPMTWGRSGVALPVLGQGTWGMGESAGQRTPRSSRGLDRRDALTAVADGHGVSSWQIALAWTLRQPGVVAIPKASRPEHVRENVASLDVRLSDGDLARLDAAFPLPAAGTPLEML